NRFVADFIGQGVMLRGRMLDGQRIETVLGEVKGVVAGDHAKTDVVDLLLRPDDVIHDDDSPLQLEVMDKAFRGAEYLYTLKLADGSDILCLVQSHHDHAIGSRIGVRLAVDHLIVFPV
ncbi:MAG TPA: TOBE domain-containing protein, partial [Chromatiales bacterium]|nr:TOBE domain-containing protein [Chromatiales bacterium]